MTPTNATQLTAKLSVRNADEAIAFYERALAAACTERYTAGGAVVFSRIEFDGAALEIKDGDAVDPPIEDLGGSPILFTLSVDDAVAGFERMVDAGASVRFELDRQVYGMLQGRVVDPFGVNWIMSQRVEELTPEQIQARTSAEFG